MATITNLAGPAQRHEHLRPFEASRDLGPVADLVEICFADTLDPDGRQYLQQMRFAAQNPGLVRWASAAAEWANLPMNGFVWEEAGRLVGNLSIIPFKVEGKRRYLIANVAVHPDYRRRGIARQLTLRAFQYARMRGALSTWLHVREENQAARNLYDSLGFKERARRTTWHSVPGMKLKDALGQFWIGPRRARDWPQQKDWLENCYPPELTWHLPLNTRALRPGLLPTIYRLVTQVHVRQWSLVDQAELQGVLSWTTTSNFADSLWLAVPEDVEPVVVYALLTYARQRLHPYRRLSLDFKAGLAAEAIRQSGFEIHQTLIWMENSLSEA